MSDGDKAIMIRWLKGQAEGMRPDSVTDIPNMPDPAKVEVIGVLKTQSTAKCLSCHPTAKYAAFWLDRKLDINARVTSGDMPRGSTMTDANKKALLDALEGLK